MVLLHTIKRKDPFTLLTWWTSIKLFAYHLHGKLNYAQSVDEHTDLFKLTTITLMLSLLPRPIANSARKEAARAARLSLTPSLD
ncbi:hypothetical protein H5410_017026 [Solanum commersonii]|uniref:Uncharacterized protein n=1 Tax=Solanum commersonii TaxID=4109 RepID=A0A9J5ZYW3_SOLCO|nr:hypothetical protein H5410_017026 [Solanum commersonii]